MLSYNPRKWYWSVIGNTSQVWSSAANAFVSTTDAAYESWLATGNDPTPIASVGQAMAVVISAAGILDGSDTTMHRISEAVALGLTNWTAADVIAWVNWRRALRAIVNGTDTSSTSIPAKPSYPSGT